MSGLDVAHSFIQRLPHASALVLACAVLGAAAEQPVLAQTMLVVTGQSDGPGACDAAGRCTTLRAAVTKADAERGDTIDVPAGTYLLQSSLDLTASMSITGAGAASTSVDGNGRVRVLTVGPDAVVTIAGLAVRHGSVGKDEFGAGIRSLGTLTLDHVDVTDNDAGGSQAADGGGFGGGIASAGTLTVRSGSVSRNHALVGGGILVFPSAGVPAGRGEVDGTRIEGNTASLGGGVAAFLPLTVDSATLDQNTASFGGGLLSEALIVVANPPLALATCFCGFVDVAASTIDGNSAGQDGAGVFVGDGASARLVTSTVSHNVAGRTGDGGAGGGVAVELAALGLTNVTLSGNDAADGGPDASVVGRGGGLAVLTSSDETRPPVAGRPSTTSLSTRMGAAAGLDRTGTFLFGTTPFAEAGLDFVTDAANTASVRRATGGGLFVDAPSVSGGRSRRTTVTLHDTILAGNASGNCLAQTVLVSSGYDLDDAHSCGLNGIGDERDVGAGLGPLQANGGATATMALAAGSPAVDAADPKCDVGTDQRGVQRPQGSRCDVGAFELQALASPAPSATAPPAPPMTGRAPDPVAGGWSLPLASLALVGLVGLGVVMRRRPPV